jgi:hypothetical protein
MRENKMIVRERNAKHGSRKHAHNGALQFDCFFGAHDVILAESRRSLCTSAGNITDLPAITGKGTFPAVRSRALFARTRFVNS